MWMVASIGKGELVFISALSWCYIWTPGVVALIFSKRKNVPLRIFSSNLRSLLLALFGGLVIAGLAFGLVLGFVKINLIDFTFQLFFTTYFSFLFTLFVLFLGGELYWRGYLWEKVKERPFRGIWIIAGLWSLWMIPLILFSPQLKAENLGFKLTLATVYNVALTPLLVDLRVRGKGIAAPALFYASLQAASLFFQMLLPDEGSWEYEIARIFLLVFIAFVFKLYSPKYWEKGNLKI